MEGQWLWVIGHAQKSSTIRGFQTLTIRVKILVLRHIETHNHIVQYVHICSWWSIILRNRKKSLMLSFCDSGQSFNMLQVVLWLMFHHIILTFPQIDIDPAMSDGSSLPFATGLPISLRVCPGMAEQNQLFLANLLTEKMRKPQGVGIPYFWIKHDKPQPTSTSTHHPYPCFCASRDPPRKKKSLGSAQSPQNITRRHPLRVNSHLSWRLDQDCWPPIPAWSLKYHHFFERWTVQSQKV